ncbi:MAG: hypothetical protein HRT65_01730 [Flavobacteriaceae bacterium]|nr:hypothetical protein [Flavobacteriaceae bacterium]
METLQYILAYSTLAIALGYLIKKYLLPKTLLATKKKDTKSCCSDDCGCH